MAGRLQLTVASLGAGLGCSVIAWPPILRAGVVFERPVVRGPGGPGPTLPGPERRRRPERPRRHRSPPKWLERLIRLVSVVSGASALAFLVYQSADPALNAEVDIAFSIPGVMLIGMFAIVLVALGVGD